MTRKLKLRPFQRPLVVSIVFVDPWTGDFAAGGIYAYTPERAARGHFSATIKRLRSIAKQWTGPRMPQLQLSFAYEKSSAKEPA